MKSLIAAFVLTASSCGRVGGAQVGQDSPTARSQSNPKQSAASDAAHPRTTLVVMGLASNESHASRLVAQLQEAGFANQDIATLLLDRESTRDFARDEHISVPPAVARPREVTGPATLPVSARDDGELAPASESTAGAVGTVVAAITKAAAGGGDIRRSLVDLGAPEAELTKYEQSIRDGSVLVWVRCADEVQRARAKASLESAGATNVELSTLTAPTSTSNAGTVHDDQTP